MPIMETLALINAGLQLAGGVGNMLGGAQTTNVNPYTAEQIQALKKAQADAMAQYQAAMAQSNTYNDQLGGIGRSMAQTGAEMRNVDQPGATDWYDNWLKEVPGFQQIASTLAESSTKDLNRSIDQQVALDTQKAMTEAMNTFAGNAYSGAAQAALGQAVAQPMAQGRVQMNQNKAGIEANTFNQQAGQAQGLTAQSTQNEFNNAIQSLMSALQAQNAQGGMVANQAANYANQGQLAAGMFNNAQAGLSSMSDPIFNVNQNPYAPMMTASNNAFGILANPDYNVPDFLKSLFTPKGVQGPVFAEDTYPIG